jgi:hypothetical protein
MEVAEGDWLEIKINCREKVQFRRSESLAGGSKIGGNGL